MHSQLANVFSELCVGLPTHYLQKQPILIPRDFKYCDFVRAAGISEICASVLWSCYTSYSDIWCWAQMFLQYAKTVKRSTKLGLKNWWRHSCDSSLVVSHTVCSYIFLVKFGLNSLFNLFFFSSLVKFIVVCTQWNSLVGMTAKITVGNVVTYSNFMPSTSRNVRVEWRMLLTDMWLT